VHVAVAEVALAEVSGSVAGRLQDFGETRRGGLEAERVAGELPLPAAQLNPYDTPAIPARGMLGTLQAPLATTTVRQRRLPLFVAT